MSAVLAASSLAVITPASAASSEPEDQSIFSCTWVTGRDGSNHRQYTTNNVPSAWPCSEIGARHFYYTDSGYSAWTPWVVASGISPTTPTTVYSPTVAYYSRGSGYGN